MVWGVMPDAERLARSVPQVPPRVLAVGVVGGDASTLTQAALLAWGQTEQERAWFGGIAFPYRVFRGTALAGLLTVWVPAAVVRPVRGEFYGAERVPRVRLSGPPAGWPALPPRYPKIGAEWLSRHHHTDYDPSGEYRDLRHELRQWH